jgi:shikimate dehydrogenase
MPPADPTHTIADLDEWDFPGTALAVLGHPIKHSISPAMHNAALADMSRHHRDYAAWRYFRFDIPPEKLPDALPRFHAAGFHGLNLTVPHKVLAFDLVQEMDEGAKKVGAVNTLRRIAGGWRGFNTDGYGLATALQENLGASVTGAPIILLGAGGAARAAAAECIQRGCSELWIGNRTASTRQTLLKELSGFAADTKLADFDPTEPPRGLPANAIVINATSLGLKPEDPAPIALRRLPPGARVFDMIYNPPQTALSREAALLGLPHGNGLEMLVHQGAKSLEIWTGALASTQAPVMHLAAKAALAATA